MSTSVNPFLGYYFDDLAVGQVIETGRITVTEDAIIRFALEWDPQPFHIDKTAAQESVFGQLVGSGLQTLLLTYWLYFDSGIFRGTAVAGLGLDDTRFLGPLFPGDTISTSITVIGKKPSHKPIRGKISVRLDTFNQNQDHIFTMTLNAYIARRT